MYAHNYTPNLEGGISSPLYITLCRKAEQSASGARPFI